MIRKRSLEIAVAILIIVGMLLGVRMELSNHPPLPLQNAPPHFQRLIKDARSRTRGIGVADLRQKLARGGDGIYVVDVREDEEWRLGHIPGAVRLSKGIIERDIEAIIHDPRAEIYLYCGVGGRSVLAAENLQRMGYRNVFSADGGYQAWVDHGYPVAHD